MVSLKASRWTLSILYIAFACATPVRTQTLPAARQPSIHRIALAPVSTPAAEREIGDGDGTIELDAGDVVVAQVLAALEQEPRYEVISPLEVARALEVNGLEPESAARPRVSRVAGMSFGADATLFIRVRRFVSRLGSGRGAYRPASVWFELELLAPDGTPLWRGEYDETQRGLTEDLLSLSRALARGLRWVSAEALAAYGARELVGRMPGGG